MRWDWRGDRLAAWKRNFAERVAFECTAASSCARQACILPCCASDHKSTPAHRHRLLWTFVHGAVGGSYHHALARQALGSSTWHRGLAGTIGAASEVDWDGGAGHLGEPLHERAPARMDRH